MEPSIYHLTIHPWLHDWSDGSPIRQHIDHIKGRGELWYVGFEHLYLYRFVQKSVAFPSFLPPHRPR